MCPGHGQGCSQQCGQQEQDEKAVCVLTKHLVASEGQLSRVGSRSAALTADPHPPPLNIPHCEKQFAEKVHMV